jgi:hypothetical protein
LLIYNDPPLSVTGIVEKMNDIDYFRFETTGGQINVVLDVAEFDANLDARLELWRPGGYTTTRLGTQVLMKAQRLAWSDPDDQLGASISISLTAGTYDLAVKSHGQYGDLGVYTLTGDLNLAPFVPNFELVAYSSQPTFTKTSSALLPLSVTDSDAVIPQMALPQASLLPAKTAVPQKAELARATDHVLSDLSKPGAKAMSMDAAINDLAALRISLGSLRK